MPSINYSIRRASSVVLLGASAAASAQVSPIAAGPGDLPAAARGALPAAGPATVRGALPAAAAVPNTAPADKEEKTVKADPPEPEADAAAGIASVTVSAERPTNRIDRQVYDVKDDAAASNASVADALNKVPSVTVDPDGTVTLRGSTNVQIMVDGKPSAMLQGESRGANLAAMMADSVESIEVINNPGAQFGTDGGGGPILNLVTRRNRKPGGMASVGANGGTGGRYNSSASGTYNEGPWGVQGSINVRHDGRNSTGDTVRDRISPFTGERSHTVQRSRQEGLNDSAGINGAVTYNLNARDTLQASASYNARSNDNRGIDSYVLTDTRPVVTSDYSRSSRRSGDNTGYSWGGRLDHKGDIDGELLKLDLRVSGADNSSNSAYANTYSVRPPGRLDAQARQANLNDKRVADFTADYERPVGQSMVKAGFKAVSTHNDIDARYFDINPQSQVETVSSTRTNRFQLDETIVALYGTWQTRLNERWGVMGGLRVEHTDLDINQVTTGVRANNSYVNYIPSLFATYKVSSESNLRFAYANRLRRPGDYELNPFVIYLDEFNVRSGNTKLKPTRTNSFELGYESRLFGMDANLRGYYRKDSDAILSRRYFINQSVLLSTSDNGPGSAASGLEFSLSGKLMPTLTLNASGNLARSEQRILDETGQSNRRATNSLSGRVRLSYQFTPQTTVQSMLNAQGRTLVGQGYREPTTTFNFTVRHAYTPRLDLLLDIQDAFNGNKMAFTSDTSTLKENSLRRYDGRVMYLGMRYRFGGATPPPRRAGGANPRARPEAGSNAGAGTAPARMPGGR